MLTDNFLDVAAFVRKGGAAHPVEARLERGDPVWVEFARAMVPMMGMPSEFIAGLVGAESGAKWKVLDIAAGHGIFGIAIARRNPNATVVGQDWRSVLEVALE